MTESFRRHEETLAFLQIKLIDMVMSCFRHVAAAWTFNDPVIPVTNIFFVWCFCVGSVYAYDHGRVSVATGIRRDSR